MVEDISRMSPREEYDEDVSMSAAQWLVEFAKIINALDDVCEGYKTHKKGVLPTHGCLFQDATRAYYDQIREIASDGQRLLEQDAPSLEEAQGLLKQLHRLAYKVDSIFPTSQLANGMTSYFDEHKNDVVKLAYIEIDDDLNFSCPQSPK